MAKIFLRNVWVVLVTASLLMTMACSNENGGKRSKRKVRPCLGDPCFDPRIAKQKVSSYNGARFGMTRSQGTKVHNGLDLLMPRGTDLYAMFDSYVYSIEHRSGWGNCIIMLSKDQGKQIFIMYAHLDHATVPVGAIVKAGDKVAISGDTGNLKEATEQGYVQSHMHLEIREFEPGLNFNQCQARNPEDFMMTELTYTGRPKYSLPCHTK
jgi:murein DD-endopeptidase MepM/ murein hydrolase activator NlpD